MKMKSIVITAAFILVAGASTAAQTHQATPTAAQANSRDATREKLRRVLAQTGPKLKVTCSQSDQQPYNFVGLMNEGLTNADSFASLVQGGGRRRSRCDSWPDLFCVGHPGASQDQCSPASCAAPVMRGEQLWFS